VFFGCRVLQSWFGYSIARHQKQTELTVGSYLIEHYFFGAI